MLAALLEWFLWLAAFMYCLVKVFQKAEHWTVRLLAVLVGIVFTGFRYVKMRFQPSIYLVTNLVKTRLPPNHGRYASSSKRS